MKRFAVLGALALVCGVARADDKKAQAYVEIDYSKLDRKIAKEPAYVGEPLYALFVLDDPGQFRCWAVLDKSKKELGYYDVLYFDLEGDGDLTKKGDRFEGKLDASRSSDRFGLTIVIPKIPVPGTEIVHTDLQIASGPSADTKGVWFSLKWAGKVPLTGAYRPKGYDSTLWGRSPATAPVFRPTPNGPFSFAIWGPGELKRGEANDIRLFAGNKGSGPDSLCPVDDKFLVPEKDRIFATVIARDEDGKEVRLRSEITGHC